MKYLMSLLFLIINCAYIQMDQYSESYIFETSEENIDVAKACFIIESEIFPQLNIEESLERLDSLTEIIVHETSKIELIDEKVKYIVNYLFVESSYCSNESNHFLINVLEEKSGNCSSLTAFFLSICHRLNIDFQAVFVPLHAFAKLKIEKEYINIDPLFKGACAHDSVYIKEYKIPKITVTNNIYLKPLSKKEFLASVYNWRGIHYNNQGDYQKAIEDFKKAKMLNPSMPEIYNGLAIAFKKNGDYKQSLLYSDTALKLNPFFVEALSTRGLTYVDKKDYERALADYNLGISLKPNNFDLLAKRGDLYSYLKDYKNALKDYNNAIESDTNDNYKYNNRGTLRFLNLEYIEAIKDYSKAIELDSFFFEAYNNRAKCKNKLGNYQGAIRDCNKAIEINPKYADVYNTRGNSKKSLNLFYDACKDWKLAYNLGCSVAIENIIKFCNIKK